MKDKVIFLALSLIIISAILGSMYFLSTKSNPQSTMQQPTNQIPQSTNTVFVFLVRNQGIDDSSLASLYVKHAKPTDIVAKFSNSLLSSTITTQLPSQKATTYFSLSDISSNVANLKALGYSWVIYDLEPSGSPQNEVANPVNSVMQAQQYAHNYGLKLMVTPAGISTDNYPAMSQYSDGFILQAMDLIAGDPTIFSNTIHNTISKIKSGNPSSIVILQDSVNRDTVSQMNTAWDLSKDVVNGITIFYSTPDQLSQMAQVYTHIDGIY